MKADIAPLPVHDAVAVIDEARCIGCTLCIQACPVDAIVGAPKLMHTVIAAQCTGCELCVPPCPVDCIEIKPLPPRDAHARAAAEATALGHAHARNARLLRLQEEKAAKAAAQRDESAARRRREAIAKAMARAKHRLQDRARRS